MSPAGPLPYVKLERVTRVAALGVRFFDPVRQRVVSDLVVHAYWPGSTRRPQPLHAGPSGIFALHSTGPEWIDLEATAGTDAFWGHLPAPRNVLLAVRDPAGRFLPFTLPAPVPPPGTGPGQLFTPDCLLASPASLPWAIDAVPLFAAPAGVAPEGMAVVRADLWNLPADRPAAGAVLAVSFDGRGIGWGMADARGSVVAVVPYPEPVDFTPGSPGAGESPWSQTWELEIAVAVQANLTAWAPLPGASAASQPSLDLCAAWGQLQHPSATVWASRSPDQTMTTAVLRANADLILSTLVDGNPSSRLLLTPAA